MKKKFKDTKVGAFLKEKAPAILDTIGEMFYLIKGVLAIVKNIITSDNNIEPQDKETAIKIARARYTRNERRFKQMA